MENVLVAKSYQGLPQISEVYTVNGKQYIRIQMKNGSLKQVRVYSPTEYKKYYGETAENQKVDKFLKTQKEVLFKGDFVHLVKGQSYPYKDWLKEHGATFRQLFGWIFQADVELPTEMPFGLELVKLPWSAVGADGEKLMADEKVQEVVEKYLYCPDGITKGGYVGQVGERIESDVFVENVSEYENDFGTAYCVRFRDENQNLMVWMTSSATATSWDLGDAIRIRGTVKDCKEYHGEYETILSRVKEVK